MTVALYSSASLIQDVQHSLPEVQHYLSLLRLNAETLPDSLVSTVSIVHTGKLSHMELFANSKTVSNVNY